MTLKSCEGNKSNDAEDTKYGQQTKCLFFKEKYNIKYTFQRLQYCCMCIKML